MRELFHPTDDNNRRVLYILDSLLLRAVRESGKMMKYEKTTGQVLITQLYTYKFYLSLYILLGIINYFELPRSNLNFTKILNVFVYTIRRFDFYVFTYSNNY